VNTHSTDPKVSDSDADGLSDGAEVNTHSTDPKVSDSDGDGLSDGAEVTTHGTNPNASDSDADGLSDADEITTHSTDPNLADSDSDGLSDGTEINTHSSDPLASDSSGDGLSDGYVVSVGFDPNTNYTGILEGSEGMTQDLRIGAEIASVANGAATLQIVLEESADLSNWSHRETVDLVVPLQAGETTKFFRYAMQGAPSDDGEAPAVPDGFALIPGGSFQMGDALDGDSDAPVVTVAVSAFYMGQYEVTKAEWDEVRTWGLSNGYTDLPSGGGKAADHPVHSINWYAMVKWCNARSEMEGRTPCYTVSGSTYRTGSSDGVVCDWTATGYRLPTEAEWEKAARGGATGQRFPWGATISHANANYRGDGDRYSYDANPFTDLRYHPDYDSGDTPYTSAVGSFAANGYGLYDMAGNVWEWCWDWYASSSYSDGAADPRGAASGSNRVLRGGSWINDASYCRVADRIVNDYPSNSFNSVGFRVALSSVPQ
jgi:formylglycine-generating enzyme required for sulfatase activity